MASLQYLNVPDLPPSYPDLPPGKPLAPPTYTVDNEGNTYYAAPDKGSMMGPVLDSGSLTAVHNNQTSTPPPLEFMTPSMKRAGSFWMETISHGQSPLAPTGYQFFRNVRDFGAKGDGSTDDTVAINQAVASFSLSDRSTLRCGQTCGSTTTLGALVYFPDIRKIGGCIKCGSKHLGNGCLVSIDYYYGCDNRDSGINRLNTTLVMQTINGLL